MLEGGMFSSLLLTLSRQIFSKPKTTFHYSVEWQFNTALLRDILICIELRRDEIMQFIPETGWIELQIICFKS